jgi:hypothetical protein
MGNCVRGSRDDDGVINVFGGGGPREVNLTAEFIAASRSGSGCSSR